MKIQEIITEVFEKTSIFDYSKIKNKSTEVIYEFSTGKCLAPGQDQDVSAAVWKNWQVTACELGSPRQQLDLEIRYEVKFKRDSYMNLSNPQQPGQRPWQGWEVLFEMNNIQVLDKLGEKRGTGILKLGNEFQVFATVFAVIRDFVKNHPQLGILFFMSLEDNRTELYRNMLQRISRADPVFQGWQWGKVSSEWFSDESDKVGIFNLWRLDWADLVTQLARRGSTRARELATMTGLFDQQQSEIITEVFEKSRIWDFQKITDADKDVIYEFSTGKCLAPGQDQEEYENHWQHWRVVDCAPPLPGREPDLQIRYEVKFQQDTFMKITDPQQRDQQPWQVWAVSFSMSNPEVLRKINKPWSTGILGLGDEYQVFATVFAVIREFVETHPQLGILGFSSMEPNRTELYQNMLQRMSRTDPAFQGWQWSADTVSGIFSVWRPGFVETLNTLIRQGYSGARALAVDYGVDWTQPLTESHIYDYSNWGFVMPDGKILEVPHLEKYNRCRTHDAVWSLLPASKKISDLDQALDRMPSLVRWYIQRGVLALDARVIHQPIDTVLAVAGTIQRLMLLLRGQFEQVVWDWPLAGKRNQGLGKLFDHTLGAEPLPGRDFRDRLGKLQAQLRDRSEKSQAKLRESSHEQGYSAWGLLLPSGKILDPDQEPAASYRKVATHDALWLTQPASKTQSDLDQALVQIPGLIRWYIESDTLFLDARIGHLPPQEALSALKHLETLFRRYQSEFIRVVWDRYNYPRGKFTTRTLINQYIPLYRVDFVQFRRNLQELRAALAAAE